jgi:hypothetical protein
MSMFGFDEATKVFLHTQAPAAQSLPTLRHATASTILEI